MKLDNIHNDISASLNIKPKAMDTPTFDPFANIGTKTPIKVNGKNAKYAYDYFSNKGVPKHVAAGLVGNLQQESGVQALTYDDGANGPGGGGVAQWSPIRYKGLKQYATSRGKNPNQIETQFDYMLHELDTTESKAKNKIFATNNVDDATVAIQDYYFRPNKKMANTNNRIASARSLPSYKWGGAKSAGIGDDMSEAGAAEGGAAWGGVGTALSLAGGIIDMTNNGKRPNKKKTVGSSTLSMAGQGAALGTTILPGWGTVIGAGVGAIGGLLTGNAKARRERLDFDKATQTTQRLFNENQENRSNMLYRQMQPYQYKYGGVKFKPEFEVERGELMRGNFQLSDGKRVGKTMYIVKGKTHEQFNPKTGTTGVLGAGEGQIFSNSLYYNNGKTIAQAAKVIANQLAKVEEKEALLHSKLDDIFEHQEAMKQYKYGGYQLPIYKDGGDTDAINRKIKSIQRYLKENPYNSADSKRRLNAQIADLTARAKTSTPTYSGKPWNPLDKTSVNVGTANPKQYLPMPGNQLKEVVIKGKRTPTAPIPTRTGAKKSIASPSIPNPNASWKPSSDFDKSIREDNRIGNLRGGSKQGTIDPIARIKNNTSDPVGGLRQTKVKFQPNWNDIGTAGRLASGYMANQAATNRMETNIPVNLTQQNYYGYADRSRLARHDVQAMAGAITNNPNIGIGQKQATFAKSANVLNDINAQENANRLQYDNGFADDQFRINAQNNAILNQRNAQQVDNRNSKRAQSAANFTGLLTNVDTALAEKEARKLDERKWNIIANSYKLQYGNGFVNDRIGNQ